MAAELKPIIIPSQFNYIAVFLSFACMLRCTYCINHHGGDLVKKRWMSGEDWVRGLNRIQSSGNIPLTLQGGEPTVHKHFYQIVQAIKPEQPIDLLTNLEVNVEQFMRMIPPARMKREAPYASIRVSYHRGQQDPDVLLKRVKYFLDQGYHIGVWAVDHPEYMDETRQVQKAALDMGIDFRLKEFLGPHQGRNYGTMRYPDAVNAREVRTADCRTTEFLIDPAGYIFRCHSDLYANRFAIGHLLDAEPPKLLGLWVSCPVYGKCNSCDIKVKNNRFQQFGHSSVEVRNISEPIGINNEYVQEVINTYGKPD
ncbi:MAG: radical SAM protein, partial [Candidatus Omnitrophica bacterium]|nr:radical SAM protein [Candidatus Omnitrophota bacterium]